MQRIKNLFMATPNYSAIVFIISILGSFALSLLIDIPAKKSILALFTIVIVYFIYSAFTIGVIRYRIKNNLDRTGLISLWKTEQTENEGFLRSRDVVLSAEESIFVLSHYIPEGATLEFSTTRNSYLADGIEKVIQARLNDPNSTEITYHRIIQSDSAEQVSNGILYQEYMNGEDQTFAHTKKIFEMLEGNVTSNVKVDFRISRPILSFPNMLIVDKKHLLFALSTKAPKLANRSNVYTNVGVFSLEDRHGVTVEGFASVFNKFFESSVPINSVKEGGPESAGD